MGYLDGLGTSLIILAIICGVVGWGLIELLIWLFSFIHITVGG